MDNLNIYELKAKIAVMEESLKALKDTVSAMNRKNLTKDNISFADLNLKQKTSLKRILLNYLMDKNNDVELWYFMENHGNRYISEIFGDYDTMIENCVSPCFLNDSLKAFKYAMASNFNKSYTWHHWSKGISRNYLLDIMEDNSLDQTIVELLEKDEPIKNLYFTEALKLIIDDFVDKIVLAD